VRHKNGRGAGDFLKAQERGVRQVFVIGVEHFLGHAVVAAEVAAVGDADAQIAQRAPKLVAEQAGGGNGLAGDGGAQVALIDDGDDAFRHGGIVTQIRIPLIYLIVCSFNTGYPTFSEGKQCGQCI